MVNTTDDPTLLLTSRVLLPVSPLFAMSSFEARLIPAALGSNLDLIDWGSWLNEATVAHDCPLYLILSTLHALLCAPIASFNRLQLAFALLALSTAAELDAFEAARSYDRLSYANGAKKVASALTTTNIFVLENGSTLLRESKWYACTVRRHGKEFDKAILLDGRWFGDLLSASHPPSPSKLVWSLTTICHELGHVVATDVRNSSFRQLFSDFRAHSCSAERVLGIEVHPKRPA